MGFFNKFKNMFNTEDLKEAEIEVDGRTQSQADELIRNFYNKDILYVFLSDSQADYEKGFSVPFIGQINENIRVLFLFSTLEKAKNYINSLNLQLVDGIYPIAEVRKADIKNNLDTLCANALVVGANSINFDIDNEATAFGCNIGYFMQVNNISTEVSMIISEEEAKKLLEENQESIDPRFNPMKILDFYNPHTLTLERAQELINLLFEKENSGFDYFSKEANIHELCFIMNYIVVNLMAEAKEKNSQKDINWLNSVIKALKSVLIYRLKQEPFLYTLIDDADGRIHMKQDCCYLFYTSRYANKLNAVDHHYTHIAGGFDEFVSMIGQINYNGVVVTDGPNTMYVFLKNDFINAYRGFEE